jgi:xanthine dehydrogenase YagR molybdenum-binding subunit
VSEVGKPAPRVDGRLKVTGAAVYAADTPVAHCAYAVIVGSHIARGTATVDDRNAQRAPGVMEVVTSANAPRVATAKSGKGPSDRVLQILQDDRVYYADQPIAVVVADTLEHAQSAAALVTARYAAEPALAQLPQALGAAYVPAAKPPTGPVDSTRGDVDAGLHAAAHRVSETYTTPVQTHNPMEPHATIAVWTGDDRLTVYDSTQYVYGVKGKLAATFGLAPDHVRVIDRFVGGAFGSKGSTWSHVVLAALAARVAGRPVKLVLTRAQMFALVGHRPMTVQTLDLGADRNGVLMAMRHRVVSETSQMDEFVEPSAMATRMLYRCDNVETSHRLVRLDVPTPTFTRAPGEASGEFALESALDELAYACDLDPLELRLRNYAERDGDTNEPWSSKELRTCYQRGADAIGWSTRARAPRATRRGDLLVGLGMATATYPARMMPSNAKVRVTGGRATVQLSTAELGTGTYTILTQIAADALGLALDAVTVELGDTALPEAPVAAGSMTTATAGSAVHAACTRARARLDRGETDVTEQARSEDFAGRKGYSCHAHGAAYAEVEVDEELGRARVTKLVGAYACGKIINPRTSRSQLMGGLVWAIGMTLEETTVRDRRTARNATRDLADYHVAVCADVPDIDVIFVDEVDPHVNVLGSKGLGEIGVCGATAAIANAIYHATGRRVRDLPITVDKLMRPT